LSLAPLGRRRTRFHVSRTLFGTLAYLVETAASLMVFDDQGTLLIEHPWPAPGTKYVGSGRPHGPRATQNGLSVTDVLRHEVLPMS
jgi:hypothetical protein